MKRLALIIAVLICVCANSAGAAIVHDNDTLVCDLLVVDSGGNPIPIDTTTDWGYIVVKYPNGDTAATDSFLIRGTNTVKIKKAGAKYGGLPSFSYFRPYGTINGTGHRGVYRYSVYVRDSSLALWWPVKMDDDFQMVPQGFLANVLDSAADATNALDTLKLYDSDTRTWGANLLKYEGSDDVDANIQSEAEDAIDGRFVFDLDGNVAANLEDIDDQDITPLVSGALLQVDVQALDADATTSIVGLKEAFDNDDVFSTGGFEAAVSLNDATGDLSDAQIEDGAIGWGGELDTAGFGANAQEAAADALAAYGASTFDASTDSVFADKSSLLASFLDQAGGTLSDAQIDLITVTFLGDSLAGIFTRLNAIRDSMDEASATGAGGDVTSIAGNTAAATNLKYAFDSNRSTYSDLFDIRTMRVDPDSAEPGMYVRGKGGHPALFLKPDSADTGQGLLVKTGRSANSAGDAIVLRPESGGNGIEIQADSDGVGISVYANNTTGSNWKPIYLEGGEDLSSASAVFEVVSNSAAPALSLGGGTGDAVKVFAGGNGDAFDIDGSGSGHGINATGGSTGHGMHLQGGGTSGSGLHLRRTGSATGMHDIALFNNDADSGFAKGDTSIISQAVYDILFDNSHNFTVQVVNAEWDSAATVIADTVWATDTSNALWNGVPTKFGYWNAKQQIGGGSSGWTAAEIDSVLRSLEWANDNSLVRLADVASLTLSGSNKTVVVYVIDSSGVDDTLPGVIVSIKDAGQTANLVGGVTIEPGKITFGLMASTQYVPVPWLTGYVFPGAPLTFTTTAGAAPDTVRIYGYNFDPGTPASPSLCRVIGYVGDGPNPIRNADVSLTLEVGSAGVVVVDTVADRLVAVRTFRAKTDSLGYFYIDVVANEYLTPANTTYRYVVTKPGVIGPIIEKSGIIVPISASARIEDLF